MPNTTTVQFTADVALVRSLAATTPLADLLAGMRNNGRTEQHIAEVLTEAANHAEDEFPTCGVCGTPNVEDAGEHADSTGHWPAATKPAERLSVWTLTRMDPVRTVQEGDYHEMYVVAKTAQAAREWAYLRAVGDNKPEPKVWLEGDEFALRVLYFYEVDDEATTGVMLAETWTVDKMSTVPFRRR